MAAVLGLGLSALITAALLGWLAAEADRPAGSFARRGLRRR